MIVKSINIISSRYAIPIFIYYYTYYFMPIYTKTLGYQSGAEEWIHRNVSPTFTDLSLFPLQKASVPYGQTRIIRSTEFVMN